MTTPYIEGLVRIQIQFEDESSRVDEIVCHCTVGDAAPSGLTLTQLQAIQTNVDLSVYTGAENIVAFLASSYHYIGSIVTDQQSSSGLQAGNSSFSPHGGGDANPALPRQCAGVISLPQAVRYRGGKGRMYVPGLGNDNVQSDGKTLTSTATARLAGWAISLQTNLSVVSGISPAPQLCILRARTQVVPHTIPKTYEPPFVEVVGTPTCSGILGTQRRRIRKVAHT